MIVDRLDICTTGTVEIDIPAITRKKVEQRPVGRHSDQVHSAAQGPVLAVQFAGGTQLSWTG